MFNITAQRNALHSNQGRLLRTDIYLWRFSVSGGSSCSSSYEAASGSPAVGLRCLRMLQAETHTGKSHVQKLSSCKSALASTCRHIRRCGNIATSLIFKTLVKQGGKGDRNTCTSHKRVCAGPHTFARKDSVHARTRTHKAKEIEHLDDGRILS